MNETVLNAYPLLGESGRLGNPSNNHSHYLRYDEHGKPDVFMTIWMAMLETVEHLGATQEEMYDINFESVIDHVNDEFSRSLLKVLQHTRFEKLLREGVVGLSGIPGLSSHSKNNTGGGCDPKLLVSTEENLS